MPSGSLLITRSNIHELTSDHILSFNSKEYWHMFFLENAGSFDKEAVLNAVLQSITPFDLVPVKYTVTGEDAYFLARNCGQAIEKFCKNLLLPIQLKDPPGVITMIIQTCSVSVDQFKMNMQFHLKKAIEKRHEESRKGFVNLSSFHKDPDLYDILFCPLSKPRFLIYILSILKRILTVTGIDLSNNGIEVLESLEILHEFKELVSVDLSNNKISDPNLSELLEKAVPALQELNLRGNPICSTFKTEMDYLKWIRNKNCSIRKLDGISVNIGLPNYQVYLCSEKAWGIVNEFLMHYFTLYDCNREALKHSYEKNAIFSLTCDHLPFQNFKECMLECYSSESKNLLEAKGNSGIFHMTNTNIVNMLCKLPLTEHDPYTFKVDVLFYEELFLVIIVSGIFKDFQETPRIRSFNRTFALKRVSSEEFTITNDMFHVTNASVDEINVSFIHSKATSRKSTPILTKEEEQDFIDVVSKITGMNSAYSRRCLQDCKWDVKKALEVFLENDEAHKIPLKAFTEDPPT